MIPAINGTVKRSGGQFHLPKDSLSYHGDFDLLKVFCQRMSGISGFEKLTLTETANENACISIMFDGSAGAYRLTIGAELIEITAGDREGAAFALTTLYWKLREGGGSCETGDITDTPSYEHRGFLLDCSRHFFDTDTVKSMIEQCSLRKLNRLHWHLSDDQGYRIESKAFPRLNSIGAYRKQLDGTEYGGFYTQHEIRDIVQFARARGVEIIPEIDMPGHVSAIIAAYPELSCSGEPLDIPVSYGIFSRILCAGKDEVIEFVKTLTDEIAPLFPYHLFHIGGDEAPKDEWEICPRCQERCKREGLKDEEELQAWFTEEVLKHLQKLGKTGVCWNESLKSGKLSESAVIQYWDEEDGDRDGDYCQEAFKGSRKCIYSYTPAFYFDWIPAFVPMMKTFADPPKLRNGGEIKKENLLGFEAALWAEQITDKQTLEKMAFPRMLVLAERAWNGKTSYEDFLIRCRQELEWLDEDGISHFSVEDADPAGEAQKNAVIAQWKPRIEYGRQSGMTQFEAVIFKVLRIKLTDLYTKEEVEEILKLIGA
ncbi:MAG: beta-N-acetylhexosaminidase [Oscillospiraceae bacterium]|nr:beta-N-acetylhexosaminidase [Oscillospiraceae bacterium]